MTPVITDTLKFTHDLPSRPLSNSQTALQDYNPDVGIKQFGRSINGAIYAFRLKATIAQ